MKYRLKASVSWIANSETDLGVFEGEDLDDAMQAAWDAAADRLEAYAEPVNEDDEE